MSKTPLPRRLSVRVSLSRALAWLDSAVPATWPVVFVLAVFLIASLFGLWSGLPGWLHVLALVAFVAVFLRMLWKAAHGFSIPTNDTAIRRLERTGGVPHRPLTALLDKPAALIDSARETWRLHRKRMMEQALKLRLVSHKNVFSKCDPLWLRIPLALLLVTGFSAFGNETFTRVEAAINPDFSGTQSPVGVLTAWVAPPSYVAVPEIHLEGHSGEPIEVPEGSTLVARVHGGSNDVTVISGERSTAFVRLDKESAALELPVPDGPVAIHQGNTDLANWLFTIVPDMPPKATFAEPPAGTVRGALRLDVIAIDDHGVTSLEAVVEWRGEEPSGGLDPIRFALPLSSRVSPRVDSVTYHDLAAHPWAGEPVTMKLVALDAKEQAGESGPAETLLPARNFLHPMALAIIGERKRVALRRASDAEIAVALDSLAAQGERYANSADVKGALEETALGLREGLSEAARSTAILLLWQTALRIEEGALAEVEADLRQAQDEAAEAFREGSRPEDLEEILANLEESLELYLDAMDETDPERDGNDPEEASQKGGRDALQDAQRREIEDLVDDVVDMATMGAPDEADERLNRLREITEDMDKAGQRMMAESQEMDQRQAMMQQIQEMMQEQQELMEESFHQSARAGLADANSPGSGKFNPPDERQESLRRELGELMRELGESGEEISQELGEAEQAMRQAAQELQRERPGLATESQGQALDLMRLGGNNLQERPGGAGPSQIAGEQPGRHNRHSRDPLGRVPPGEGSTVTGEVGLPTEPEVRRSRKIVQELRRRAGDEERPELDQDYATRLLDWY